MSAQKTLIGLCVVLGFINCAPNDGADGTERSLNILRALYEVSRSFAQSLSLDATLDALAQNAVELLDVDAAAIRMPDARREQLTNGRRRRFRVHARRL